MTWWRWGAIVWFLTGTAVILVLLLLKPANAHEWYERSCCDETHCHPVPSGTVEETGEGVTVRDFGILSYDDPRLRWSRDEQDHLCISKTWSQSKLLCVYRKPKMF